MECPLPAPRRKIERVALLDQVYEVLKERILDRVYEPGAKLNIDALGRELKVSSTPLREALGRLTAEGLVTAAPFVGFAVAPMPDAKYYRDLYTLRRVIEPWAAAETARLRPAATIETLDAAVRAMDGSSLSRRYSRFRDFSDADDAFHRTIVAGTGNAPACKAYEDLRIHLHMSRLYINHEQDAQSTRVQHLAILEAIRTGDSKAAAQRMLEHLSQSETKLLE
jgi:DNA-binding GntR family transcriptional regulator